MRIVRSLRGLELEKHPSISETLDWARTLVLLGVEHADTETTISTLNLLLKVPKRHRHRDQGTVRSALGAGALWVIEVLTDFVAELPSCRLAGLDPREHRRGAFRGQRDATR